MVQVHTLLLCVLMGFAGVDLCFDSLVLFNHLECPYENLLQVQTYYKRTRATAIVPLITGMIVVLALSLLRCAFYRRWPRDFISLACFLLLLPYYLFVMEPAEDACLGAHSSTISEMQLRDGLFKVGLGHVFIISIGMVIAGLEVEWSFAEKKEKKP